MALLTGIRNHLLSTALGITLLALPGSAQEHYTLIEGTDAAEKSKSMEWSATAETGEQRSPGRPGSFTGPAPRR